MKLVVNVGVQLSLRVHIMKERGQHAGSLYFCFEKIICMIPNRKQNICFIFIVLLSTFHSLNQ